jgi:hypothetical protein
MSLTFDHRGLLPPGIHDATLADIDASFARFQKSDRRIKLFEKLKAYLLELGRTGWQFEVIIDGSFVMPPVDEPDDIDIILVLPADWDMFQTLRPFEYNVVSRKFTRREYQLDVLPATAGSEAERRYRLLFQGIRIEWCQRFGWPAGSEKGLVRLVT